MVNQIQNKSENKLIFFKLALEQARINEGSTFTNPSVGCVIVKNGCVISSGCTSIKGRPHAEFNALSKKKLFKNSSLYVTLEPCCHFGVTPPCVNLISKKKIKKVFFSVYDPDKRTYKKSLQFFKKKKILYKFGGLKKEVFFFYKKYFKTFTSLIPNIDLKIACSNDLYTKHINNKWITNDQSRKTGHLLRSKYNLLITTSKTINEDNALFNCRIDGLENKNPDLMIIDRKLKIKLNLLIFNKKIKRKIIVVTCTDKKDKIRFLRKKNIKIIKINTLNSKTDFLFLFKLIKKMNYNKVLIEAGINFSLLLKKFSLINDLFLFKSSVNLNKNGKNKIQKTFFKGKKNYRKIKVNLKSDSLHEVNFN
jgi:diaminohydroxyphosphoribosylaminopyrimidine deaminase/5-amino-6-(5-phosphoribosylamino)uracil reductase